MILIIICVSLILWLGIKEKRRHTNRLNKIPVRININGIRGKSTITRMVYSVLREDHIRVVGKTTGTDARMLYWFTDKEYPVIRKPQGANIGEQRDIIRKVVKQRATALVNECMAVNPDYQITFQNDLVMANIGVIVNVMEDHMDVLGPTLQDVAQAFTATIPYNGKLVVMQDKYTKFFAKEARKRKTELIVVDKEKVPESYLRKFDYLVFPDNVAITLGVAQALGIDQQTALQGMLNAPPDPGAVEIKYFQANSTTNVFVNAFAANEPQSTKAILNKVESYDYPYSKKIVILNCRSDRVDRTRQFVENFIAEVDYDTLICTGKSTQMVTDKMQSQPNKRYLNLEGAPFADIERTILKESQHALVFCVGNIHGPGGRIAEFIEGIE
ncbi:poly-gamma-glutamate synthase PgsB [Staphylococcus lugdunensis]|uniref:Poly-gamma-glutamate synthase PgsB n=1 Tax=Staphylococcus lugdunensis TaxID=28035 RepID=A0A292DJW4_STALU|nr:MULTISPECIES: poly-gamma-glutamate synthase PgsB [Staphylococcus]AMG62063.1 poly-gamma-glutamate synthase PgsB [Staphylococcus lugdunensis]ARB76914.1 poly-gamma-glutamate synthase PgsB [Staphylococcus lugdunensis]ARJ08349.1 poly-gamma-glutamate synthase PgsB [Staphylococcus lugdunensis]ARJ10584.1 poly-gamma-glutamate synthase PgsB [Staphylococcus lugdunensis]ARJ15438.1 poly-gamma-glutamate synthase PgsB [Staphylococcus lugdunensis]